MDPNQNLLRNQVAAKTRRIVERQAPLELEKFLAQGRKRSRHLATAADALFRHAPSAARPPQP